MCDSQFECWSPILVWCWPSLSIISLVCKYIVIFHHCVIFHLQAISFILFLNKKSVIFPTHPSSCLTLSPHDETSLGCVDETSREKRCSTCGQNNQNTRWSNPITHGPLELHGLIAWTFINFFGPFQIDFFAIVFIGLLWSQDIFICYFHYRPRILFFSVMEM